ncbi:alpha/beta fold hydrolase [Hyphococcus luteus]|uniref:Alpha/beta hydrolase n=1 Tax=Hyphococcus luteus TaxID=2058213 RepID=A0A2S7K6Z1_9PROT|nr:alpha/beta hydrolase [Marinicaulis flavus]PQA88228.1 alpha/beta hydrolase [Marinicaulis flavus]
MSDKHTFVLVHGGMCCGRWWRETADMLRAKGHEVYTPTLTGLGERAHLTGRKVNLTTHALDVANLVKWEELKDTVLVGHSYGGMVISAAAELIPEGTIRSIVYLDAMYLDDGECVFDAAPEFKDAVGDADEIPTPSPSMFGYDGAIAAYMERTGSPQPVETFAEKLKLTGARDRVPVKTFVLALNSGIPAFQDYYDRLKPDPSWRTETMDTRHNMMLEAPEETAAVLLRAAI